MSKRSINFIEPGQDPKYTVTKQLKMNARWKSLWYHEIQLIVKRSYILPGATELNNKSTKIKILIRKYQSLFWYLFDRYLFSVLTTMIYMYIYMYQTYRKQTNLVPYYFSLYDAIFCTIYLWVIFLCELENCTS